MQFVLSFSNDSTSDKAIEVYYLYYSIVSILACVLTTVEAPHVVQGRWSYDSRDSHSQRHLVLMYIRSSILLLSFPLVDPLVIFMGVSF